MKLYTLPSALLAAFAALFGQGTGHAAPAAQPPPAAAASWVFHTTRDAATNPHTDVLLRIGGKNVPVRRHVYAEFNTVARKDYHNYQVPASAVAACTGWWAGQGEDLYVVRRGGHWVVFRRVTDEQAPTQPYRPYKVVAAR